MSWNWAAVGALGTWVAAAATIGYLIYSYKLWRTTEKVAHASTEQAIASREQASIAREQFEITKKAILAEARPFVWCRRSELSAFKGGAGLACKFVLTNTGRLPANELQCSFGLYTEQGEYERPLEATPATQLVPGADFAQEVPILDPKFLALSNQSKRTTVTIKARYVNPSTKENYVTDTIVEWSRELGSRQISTSAS